MLTSLVGRAGPVREVAGLLGECRLEPLALPGPDARAGGAEAVVLFTDRARRAGARFAVEEQAGPAVARLEALGVAQLLDRLDDSLALMADGDRLADHRDRGRRRHGRGRHRGGP